MSKVNSFLRRTYRHLCACSLFQFERLSSSGFQQNRPVFLTLLGSFYSVHSQARSLFFLIPYLIRRDFVACRFLMLSATATCINFPSVRFLADLTALETHISSSCHVVRVQVTETASNLRMFIKS